MDIALKGKVVCVESIEQDYDDMLMQLSELVLAAVEEAAKLVESLVKEISKVGAQGPAWALKFSDGKEVRSI